jgi:hypothetical protein
MLRRVIASPTAFSDPGSTKISVPHTVPAVAPTHHCRGTNLLKAEHAKQFTEAVQTLLEQAIDGFIGPVARCAGALVMILCWRSRSGIVVYLMSMVGRPV